jgi:hypothetical protein
MDTVILKLYGPGKFKLEPKAKVWFLPEVKQRRFSDLSPTERNSKRLYLRKFTLKPPETDRYVPQVTMFETLTKDRQHLRFILKIQMSLPKLLYRNSLQEVIEGKLDRVLECLQASLQHVGIHTDCATLANATVSAAHFAKNIPLPPHIQMRDIARELCRIDINKIIDVREKEVKHGGRWLNLHSGTVGRVFYDKVSDCLRPKNKREDKYHIDHERAIVERYHLQSREVFRYEYRLQRTPTVVRVINAMLKREAKMPVVFRDLFTPGLWKAIVVDSWQTIMDRPENQLALFAEQNPLALLWHILSKVTGENPSARKIDSALMSYGLAIAVQHAGGAKEVRGILAHFMSADHPERITEKIDTAARFASGLSYSNNIAFLGEAIQRFEPVTLDFLEGWV